MNWVGGVRKRVKKKGEKRIQKEFFEKKRFESKLRRVCDTSPSKSMTTISQDLLSIHTVNHLHKTSQGKSLHVNKRITHVDLERIFDPLTCYRKRERNLELPMSPIETPSKLELQDQYMLRDMKGYRYGSTDHIPTQNPIVSAPIKQEKNSSLNEHYITYSTCLQLPRHNNLSISLGENEQKSYASSIEQQQASHAFAFGHQQRSQASTVEHQQKGHAFAFVHQQKDHAFDFEHQQKSNASSIERQQASHTFAFEHQQRNHASAVEHHQKSHAFAFEHQQSSSNQWNQDNSAYNSSPWSRSSCASPHPSIPEVSFNSQICNDSCSSPPQHISQNLPAGFTSQKCVYAPADRTTNPNAIPQLHSSFNLYERLTNTRCKLVPSSLPSSPENMEQAIVFLGQSQDENEHFLTQEGSVDLLSNEDVCDLDSDTKISHMSHESLVLSHTNHLSHTSTQRSKSQPIMETQVVLTSPVLQHKPVFRDRQNVSSPLCQVQRETCMLNRYSNNVREHMEVSGSDTLEHIEPSSSNSDWKIFIYNDGRNRSCQSHEKTDVKIGMNSISDDVLKEVLALDEELSYSINTQQINDSALDFDMCTLCSSQSSTANDLCCHESFTIKQNALQVSEKLLIDTEVNTDNTLKKQVPKHQQICKKENGNMKGNTNTYSANEDRNNNMQTDGQSDEEEINTDDQSDEEEINNIQTEDQSDEDEINNINTNDQSDEDEINNINIDDKSDEEEINNINTDDHSDEDRINTIQTDGQSDEEEINNINTDDQSDEDQINNISNEIHYCVYGHAIQTTGIATKATGVTTQKSSCATQTTGASTQTTGATHTTGLHCSTCSCLSVIGCDGQPNEVSYASHQQSIVETLHADLISSQENDGSATEVLFPPCRISNQPHHHQQYQQLQQLTGNIPNFPMTSEGSDDHQPCTGNLSDDKENMYRGKEFVDGNYSVRYSLRTRNINK